MSLLSAALADNERTVLPPTYTQNIKQTNGSVPVIFGQTDIPIGQNVGNYLGKRQEDVKKELKPKYVRSNDGSMEQINKPPVLLKLKPFKIRSSFINM